MKNIVKTFLVVSTIGIFGISIQADTTPGTTSKTHSNQASDSSKVWNKTEIENFVKKAANGGLFEVQMGDTASKKATNQQVRNFANRMVTDHSAANQMLHAAVQGLNVTIPSTLEKQYQDQINRLSKVKANEFDKEYMNQMVKDHEKDVSEFEKAEKNLPAGALKTWVSATLSTIKKHLDMAKSIVANEKK